MAPFIIHHDSAREYFFREGCFITELSNGEHDPALSVARARVQPGRTTLWHSLYGITERYVVLQGEGLVEIGEEPPAILSPGDVAVIPPGCRQRISNTGQTDLVFLALCTPRFNPEAYCDLSG